MPAEDHAKEDSLWAKRESIAANRPLFTLPHRPAQDHAKEAEDHAKEAEDHAKEGSLWATRESIAANRPRPKYSWSSSRVTGSSEHAQHTCCSSSCALLASTCTRPSWSLPLQLVPVIRFFLQRSLALLKIREQHTDCFNRL